MKPARILWKVAELPRSPAWVGHGYCVCSGSAADWNLDLVAFVEGFGWFHKRSDATVLYVPDRVPQDDQEFALLKQAVEERIQTRNIQVADIVPGFRGIANA